jgi:hypothetical protein
MQGLADKASVPTTYVIDKRILGVTMRRKNGIRTYPWPSAEEGNPALPPPPLPPPLPPLLPPPPEDEGIPVAKRPRLQAPTIFATAVDRVPTDPSDDTSTYPVTPAVPLPSVTASRVPDNRWKGEEEDTKLTEASCKSCLTKLLCLRLRIGMYL